MTDKTQPDSGRATGGIVEMLHARIAELEARVQELGAMARENRSRRIVELEAQLEALRAALAASPTPPAEQQAITPETGNSVSTQGAAITSESGKPPAEQQAAPKAAPAWEHHARKLTQWLHCMSHNDSYFGEPAGLVKQVTGELNRLIGAAPQQEAQEPVVAAVFDEQLGRPVLVEGAPLLRHGQELYTAPQPAPAPLSDNAKDAARYRWLIDQHWIQTEVDWRLISTDQDSTIKQLDAAIDAAIAAQGGE